MKKMRGRKKTGLKNLGGDIMEKMKKKGKVTIGAILIVALLASMAFMSSVSAQATSQNVSDIGAKEKEVISQVTETGKFSKNVEAAEKIRKEIEREMEKEIETSVNNSFQKELTRGSVVYLGIDATFYNADEGDKGTSTWGVCPRFYGSEYYLNANKDEAASVVGPGGCGGAGAWAWVGKYFYVSGSGSQTANIRMEGHMYGLTSAFAGGSGNSNIDLVVKDLDTGTKYTTNIYSQSAGGVGWFEVDEDFNNGVAVNLQAGHDYIAYLELQTSAAVYGAGEGGSDFGRQDGDFDGEGTNYFHIKVDF